MQVTTSGLKAVHMVSATSAAEVTQPRSRFAAALQDIFGGFANLSFWYVVGVAEVRQRYRRSVIGPLWITISQGISALVIGFVLGGVTGSPPARYIPWVVFSISIWSYVSSCINDGANTFISNNGTIISVRRPLMSYVMLSMWRAAIVLMHSIIVFVIVYAVYHRKFSLIQLMVVPGFIMLSANLAWIALLCAILGARFRDVPIIILNIFTVLFWTTPIMFYPDQFKTGITAMVFKINPFTYLMAVVREPVLDQQIGLLGWLICLAILVVGWTITLLVFARTRARVPYWM